MALNVWQTGMLTAKLDNDNSKQPDSFPIQISLGTWVCKMLSKMLK